MENKTLRTILLIFTAAILVVCSFGGGLVTGQVVPNMFPVSRAVPTQPPAAGQSGTPAELETLFVPFWEAWDIVHREYLVQPLDDAALMQGAIRGMMEALGDEHSTYMDPLEYEDATTAMQGEYAGIGAYVDTNAEVLTIVRPIPGSPAEAAGLLPDDQVLAVDGVDMTSTDPELVRLKVLGPAGTKVLLTIGRAGVEPFDVEITRAVITIPSVESKMLDDNIGYIRLSIFGDNTIRDIHQELQKLMAQNPRALVLDLRDNGGGYLHVAVAVGSEFINDGVLLHEKFGDGTLTPYRVTPNGLATEIPLVVLVNGYTASASEIVAGAIQEYGRGRLVGQTTYGKGTVQNWIPLSNGEGAVRVTIAEWLTPDQITIHKIGLTPDVVVEMTEEDYLAGRDLQLEAAIQLLLDQ